eukprot:598569-Pleurochrysis_carterae.AAC.1
MTGEEESKGESKSERARERERWRGREQGREQERERERATERERKRARTARLVVGHLDRGGALVLLVLKRAVKQQHTRVGNLPEDQQGKGKQSGSV